MAMLRGESSRSTRTVSNICAIQEVLPATDTRPREIFKSDFASLQKLAPARKLGPMAQFYEPARFIRKCTSVFSGPLGNFISELKTYPEASKKISVEFAFSYFSIWNLPWQKNERFLNDFLFENDIEDLSRRLIDFVSLVEAESMSSPEPAWTLLAPAF